MQKKILNIQQAFNLATQFLSERNLKQAKTICEAILAVNPHHADTYDLLGQLFSYQNYFDEAKKQFAKAVALDDENASYLMHLGTAYFYLEHYDLAIEYLLKSKKQNDSVPELYYNIGLVLQSVGNIQKAQAFYRYAIKLKPNYAKPYNNLGTLALQYGRINQAEYYLKNYRSLKPDSINGLVNLANVNIYRLNFNEAKIQLADALAQEPKKACIYSAYAQLYKFCGQSENEITYCRKAIDLDANNPTYHVNIALALLAKEITLEGFEEYEWRLQQFYYKNLLSRFKLPMWQGENLNGKILLVNAEQGFGDVLQFTQILKLVKTSSNKIILRVREPLVELLRTLPWADEVISVEDILPVYDFHIPLISIFYYSRFNIKDFKPESAYLKAPRSLVMSWQDKIQPLDKFNIGICCSGNKEQVLNTFREVELNKVLTLKISDNIQFYNLQMMLSPTEKQLLASHQVINLMPFVKSFADTAALIMQLNLVITVDTAIAHLAAALGKEVWLMQSKLIDWRYTVKNGHPFTYPTMRIYSQKKLMQWGDVLLNISKDLAE